MAVAGRQLNAGAGRHAERTGEHTGREGQDGEGFAHLSLREVAAADPHHPMCRFSVQRHQCCMFLVIL